MRLCFVLMFRWNGQNYIRGHRFFMFSMIRTCTLHIRLRGPLRFLCDSEAKNIPGDSFGDTGGREQGCEISPNATSNMIINKINPSYRLIKFSTTYKLRHSYSARSEAAILDISLQHGTSVGGNFGCRLPDIHVRTHVKVSALSCPGV